MQIFAYFPRNFSSFLGSKKGFWRGVFFATKGGVVYKNLKNVTNRGFIFCYQGRFATKEPREGPPPLLVAK